MKKLIEFIKTKDKEVKTSSSTSSKSTDKTLKVSASNGQQNVQPRDLFWDDYSDIGYC